MGMEDDFLQNDVDDEKTIEYIKNYWPQELKETFSDDEFYYFLDLISRPVKLSVGRELITYLKERSDLEFRIN